jgi:Fic family protein
MPSAQTILTLRAQTFSSASIPVSTGWLLAECMEFRGKQELWTHQRPEVLRALREQAMIQSVESSNRIEGVTVSADRLRPVVLGKSKPRDRSEEELAGYRRALDWIFTRRGPVRIGPRTILHLHAICQRGAADAGEFKTRDNEIIEVTASGQRTVRFKPTAAKQTPQAVAELCDAYETLIDKPDAPPLLVVATTVFDLLCIHPFRDGNGRVSRLLATLLLQQQGFIVGRYVSLERLIEESKEDYYRVLHSCSVGWHEGKNPILPWWNYFLSIIRRAYAEFAEQVEHPTSRPKSELIERAALEMVGPFTLAQLRAQLPGVSLALVKKVLNDLQRRKKLRLTGRGRGARWEVRTK